MSKKSGKMKYVPAMVLLEINDLKMEEGLMEDSIAFKEMVKYSRIGRCLEKDFRKQFIKNNSGKRKWRLEI
jgi:hypothetical protein